MTPAEPDPDPDPASPSPLIPAFPRALRCWMSHSQLSNEVAARLRHTVASHCATPGLCSLPSLCSWSSSAPSGPRSAQWCWSHTPTVLGLCRGITVLSQRESEEQLPIHIRVNVGSAKPRAAGGSPFLLPAQAWERLGESGTRRRLRSSA